ncbi:MAG: PilN domain-containing protein, partial [Candidatus Krumholzibacteria bacterium]|nr:PilN domain-containing protein [Candidatus Krumholzibacteria bacterium]
VSFNLPSNCWLTDIVEDSPNLYSINGIAFSNYTIADMITNLEGSQLFTKVGLDIAEKGKINDREVMKFRLTASALPQ